MNTEITNETCLNLVSIKYTWKIRNFSMCNEKYIQSPLFHAKDLFEYKWYLQLYPRGTSTSDRSFVSVFIYLSKDSMSDVYTRSNLQLLNHKMESSVTTPDVIFYCQRGAGYKFSNFVSRKYLTDNRSVLLPNDTLTVVCDLRLRSGTYCHTQTKALENELPAYKLKVLKDLEYLLENSILTDFTIITNNTNFKAHKAILAARSSVFQDIILKCTATDSNVIKISDVTSASFERLLKFMYSGKVDNLEHHAQDLIQVADRYGVNDLKYLCEKVLCRQLKPSNAVHMLNLASKYHTPLLRQKSINVMIDELKRNNKNNFNLEAMSESKIPYLISAFTSLEKLKTP